jgi:serine/threonine protein kinase, bacterial
VLNLSIPLLAAGLAFAGILHAQADSRGGAYPGPTEDCNTTLGGLVIAYSGALTVAPSGEVLVAETRAGCIVRIDSAGVVHRFIGGGGRSDACPACGVRLGRPTDTAVAADGTVYTIDRDTQHLLSVKPDGTTTVLPIGGEAFDVPRALALDKAGRLYVSGDDTVRRLDPSGPVLVAGGGGGDVGPGAPATSVRLSRASPIEVGPDGSLYLVQTSLHRVLRVDPAGTVTVFAGTGIEGDTGDNGPATKANIAPEGIAVDDAGNVYLSDEFNHRIRRVDPSGMITNFAGRGVSSFAGENGDGGPAAQAAFAYPTSLAFGNGNLYVIDSGTRPRIRKIDSAGIIRTMAGG